MKKLFQLRLLNFRTFLNLFSKVSAVPKPFSINWINMLYLVMLNQSEMLRKSIKVIKRGAYK